MTQSTKDDALRTARDFVMNKCAHIQGSLEVFEAISATLAEPTTQKTPPEPNQPRMFTAPLVWQERKHSAWTYLYAGSFYAGFVVKQSGDTGLYIAVDARGPLLGQYATIEAAKTALEDALIAAGLGEG